MAQPNEPDKNTQDEWQRDPSNWVWGVFYFNRKDKRLAVPKKVEWMGITINFAHPLAFTITLLIIGWVVFLGMLPTIASI